MSTNKERESKLMSDRLTVIYDRVKLAKLADEQDAGGWHLPPPKAPQVKKEEDPPQERGD